MVRKLLMALAALTLLACGGSSLVNVNRLRRAPRCHADAHVVAEDKAGTLFPVHIVSKDSGKAFFYLPLTEAQRAQIFDYLADHCGFGPP